MDWSADSEGMRKQFMRIVALLLGLSVLAERASRAPLAVRLYVMGLLRPAEQVASDFVTGEALELAGVDDDPASALHLAVRLRALAIMLAAFADRFSGDGHVHVRTVPMVVDAAGNLTHCGRGRLQPFDTS